MSLRKAGAIASFAFHLVAVSPVLSTFQAGPHQNHLSKERRGKDQAFISPGLNATALALFERSRLSYERAYGYYGRVPKEVKISHRVLSLDFEIETCARVKLTPELFLQRGGIDLSSKSGNKETLVQEGFYRHSDDENSWDPPTTNWPKVSDYFTLGIDGIGKKLTPDDEPTLVRKRYRQEMGGQIEIETSLMRPEEALKSSFTQELQTVMERLWFEKQNHSGASHAARWYPLPFVDAKGIKIYGSTSPSGLCTSCHVQWTVGLSMEEVPSLLAMTTSRELQKILHIIDGICGRREQGCTQDYKAFVSLAAWTLSMVKNCEACNHPKRCAAPWLVRTHFGDLAMHLKERLGLNSFQHMPADVLEAAQVKKTGKVLPHGVVDYLRFPEMAEMSGFVYSRAGCNASSQQTREDIPTTPEGLLQLSRTMLKERRYIDKELADRACSIHGRNDILVSDFTAEEWLRGLMRGKDLMSDHDSPISESSFSHLVWKSMGSWRMKPGSNRVYLECRHSNKCLGTGSRPGAAALIRTVAKRMRQFERDIKTKRSQEPRAPAATKSKWIRHQSSVEQARVAAEVKAHGQIFRQRSSFSF